MRLNMMADRNAVLRILDANINRALEGLRVCEDLIRFHLPAPRHRRYRGARQAGLGSASQYRRLRSLRHALASQARRLPVNSTEMLRIRNSRRDPGRLARASSVKSLEHLLLINLQRVKEAIRVLEESSRLIAPSQTLGFQTLRFRTYDVERDLLIHFASRNVSRARKITR